MPYDESQPEPSTEPDTPNHTKFYGADSSANYDGFRRHDDTESFTEYYSRLAILNSGIWTGHWSDKKALRRADNLAIFDGIASSLELSPHQKIIGRDQFDTLNLRDLSSPNGIDATLVAIMVAAIACRPDGRIYHPSRGAETNDTLFVELIDELGYRPGVVYSCYEKVLNRVNF
ncbi:hypothetical protein [Halapricum desulfuricans]|uniref:Uncharacterized protein n=1 Tax=Halapricum desulfuricans TaxID=2841257 RepID=A0A897N0Y7_9EURY|nr:hypothetical protein [Halapricum desulfuricans]QSG06354.1 hypothetical protein HSR121_2022 [Halapricum desulfuricans]